MKLLIIQFAEHEVPGTISERAGQLDIEPTVVHLYRGDRLPSPDDYSGVMALGGPFCVYAPDPDPIVETAVKFVEEVVDRNLPYYGICLGGQILASILGAPVRRNPVPEIGFYEIELSEEGLSNPIFRGIPATFTGFEWHGDTFDTPDDCLHLAGSELCDNQAFSYRNRQFAVQFDIQVTPEMVERWLEVERDWVRRAEPTVEERIVLRQAREHAETLKSYSFKLFNNFLAVISKG